MITLTALLLAFAPPAEPAPVVGRPADPTPLVAPITEVVVYGGSARVRRSAQLPGGGLFVVQGLPGLLDPDAVRVRLSQGSVASVEVNDRHALAVPDARVQELRARLEGLLADRRVSADAQVLASVTRDHFLSLLKDESTAHHEEVAQGRVNAETWEENLRWITEGLKTAQSELRTVEKQIADLDTVIKDAQTELGAAESGDVLLRDVVVDVLSSAGATFDLEYLVGSAGWMPQYDLRTAADARSVELGYRAKVWQHTGEDWADCALVLSTAQPQRGAQGPDPSPIQVRIFDPRPVPAAAVSRADSLDEETKKNLRALGYAGNAPPNPFGYEVYETSVQSQGLSVQFRLPRPETVESRDRPSTVLIGQQTLEVQPEHIVVPALDTTVWVRGRTKNTTPWVMLPGPASVYFGADFIGQSTFADAVMPDQEFTLHLGADPGVTCERIQTQDLHEEPSFLSKRQSQVAGWRVALENHGAHPADPDGSVVVIVREAIPVAADDRIEVEVESESARSATDDRWRKDQEERGLHTWFQRVPKDGKAELTWTVRTTWPHDLQIANGPGR
jgi:uncharacterized protein (TIGR02231 family)